MAHFAGKFVSTVAGLGTLALVASPTAAQAPAQVSFDQGTWPLESYANNVQKVADEDRRGGGDFDRGGEHFERGGHQERDFDERGDEDFDYGPGIFLGPGWAYGPWPGTAYLCSPGGGYPLGLGMWPDYSYGPCFQHHRDLSRREVRMRMKHWLASAGNHRLKIGKVKVLNNNTAIVDIDTLDNSLVEKLAVNRHTGQIHRLG